MKYVAFEGNYISKLSLGTVQFGTTYGIANKIGRPLVKDVSSIIDFLQSNGLNCFDTARGYGDAESLLGEIIKDKKSSFIITKISSREFLERLSFSIEESMKNLKQSFLFALLLHDSKLLYSWNKDMSFSVNTLKRNGKIKYFGVSIYTQEEFELALDNDCINIIQIPFNIFDLRAIKLDWINKAKEKNKLLIIRSIFLQGLLFMKENEIPSNLLDAVPYIKVLNKLCEKYNMTRVDLLLAFVDSFIENSIILFGCESIEQASENLERFKNIKKLDYNIRCDIYKKFYNISENIYNPVKW